MGDQPHILVVDDQESNRGLLVRLLGRNGWKVGQADGGRAALAAIESGRPDLVLLDLMMPDLDGFEVLARLRAGDGPFLPVIVISAAHEDAARLRALREGANDFVVKPFRNEELLLRVRNLLALKAAHDELAACNDRTAQLVETRTAELAAANERLMAADHYKDELLAVIGHELRTPLTAIVGYSALLAEALGGMPGPAAEFVGEIRRGATRLSELMSCLLDYARARAGKLELDLREIDFQALLHDVVEPFRAAAAEKGIAFELAIADEARVMADRRRLAIALAALADNAVKFTPAGGRVAIECHVADGQVTTRVCDTGIGFGPHERPALFGDFRQVDMSKTRAAGGVGLGLALALALAEAHGGTITAESPGKGCGATFRLSLPVRPARARRISA